MVHQRKDGEEQRLQQVPHWHSMGEDIYSKCSIIIFKNTTRDLNLQVWHIKIHMPGQFDLDRDALFRPSFTSGKPFEASLNTALGFHRHSPGHICFVDVLVGDPVNFLSTQLEWPSSLWFPFVWSHNLKSNLAIIDPTLCSSTPFAPGRPWKYNTNVTEYFLEDETTTTLRMRERDTRVETHDHGDSYLKISGDPCSSHV